MNSAPAGAPAALIITHGSDREQPTEIGGRGRKGEDENDYLLTVIL